VSAQFEQVNIVMEFYPPFEERETDELIVLANSVEDYWSPEAIELAKIELSRRNVSDDEQKEKLRKWEEEFNDIEKDFLKDINKKNLQ